MLVSTAYVTGKPIITSTMNNKNGLIDTAQKMGIPVNKRIKQGEQNE